MTAAIDLYTWPTPNGHKVHIMLEETGLEYNVIPVNIGKGEQFAPDFLKISPNNKMPAMVDPEGPGGKPFALAESGAMLIYLAEKTGRFLSHRPRRALPHPAMADDPDGPCRADAGPDKPFPELCGREDPIRHKPLCQRGHAALQRARRPPRRKRMARRRRLFHRRHGDISVAPQLGEPGARTSRRIPISRAGSGRSRPARRRRAAARCWPTGAGRAA